MRNLTYAAELSAYLTSRFDALELLHEEVGYTLWRGNQNGATVGIHCLPEWSLQEGSAHKPRERFEALASSAIRGMPTLLESSTKDDHQLFLHSWTDFNPWDEAVLTRETALTMGVELFDLLAEIHSRGVLHGDLQTSRFGLTKDGGDFYLLPCFKPTADESSADSELRSALDVIRSFLDTAELSRLDGLSSGREVARQLSRLLSCSRPDRAEPELIGRDDALKQLNEAFARGGALVVEAPAGGGKSRLLSEWSKTVKARVLSGKASREVAPSPFGLFKSAFSALELELTERPDWARHLSWLIDDGPIREALAKQSYNQRGSMIWLTGLLEACHDDRPTVLILEDVQWADEFAMEFARYWASESRGALMVLSCRVDELQPDHPYFRLDCPRLRLPPLSENQARRVLRSLQPGASAVLLESSVKRAKGNPFLLVQFLRSGSTEGDLYKVRVSSMGDATRRTLAIASVLGDTVEESAVVHCLGAEPDFEQAVREDLLEVSGSTYRFTHDRLREACLSELGPEEWCRVHRRAAEYFLGRGERDNNKIAYHYHMAGEPGRGADFAIEAARSARVEYDLNTALFYGQIALAGLEEDDPRCAEVFVELGDGFRLVGRYRESEEQFLQALGRWDAPLKRAEILYSLGDVYFKQAKLEDARRVLVQALSILGRKHPRSLYRPFLWQASLLFLKSGNGGAVAEREKELLVARLYNRLAYVGWFLEGPVASIWAHLCELNIAKKHGDSVELARAQANHAMAMSAIPLWQRAVEFGERALETATRVGDLWCEDAVGHFYGAALLGACRLKDAREVLTQAREKIRKTGDRWEENGICYHLAIVYYRLGALEKAATLARQTQKNGVEIEDRLAAGDNLNTLARAKDGEFPIDLLEKEKRYSSPDVQRACEMLCAEAIVAIRRQDYSGATRLLEEALSRYRAKRVQNLYSASVPCWLATSVRLECLAASADRRKGLLRKLESVVLQALKQGRRYRTNLPHALREKALVAILRGDFCAARTSLKESIDFAASKDMAHEWKLSSQIWRHFAWSLGVAELEAPELKEPEYLWLLGLQSPRSAGAEWEGLLRVATGISQCLSTPTVLHQLYHGCREILGGNTDCSIVQITDNGEATELVGDFGCAIPAERPDWNERPIPGFEGRTCLLVRRRSLKEQEQLFLEFLTTVAGAVVDRARRTISSTLLSRDLQRSTDQLHEEAVQLVQAKEQLLLSERLALTGRLAAGLVHDLRNLISGINAGVETLAVDNKSALRELHDILEAGKQSNQLLDRLSGVCKGEALGVQAIALEKRVSESAPLLRSLCGPLIELEFELAETPTVRMDPMLLDRILLNLVMNARDAVSTVGEVVVRVEERGISEILDGFPDKVPPGDYTFIEVRDNGPGIPEDVFPRIFEMHFTTKAGGIGVGLATVREMVSEVGGRIKVTTDSRGSSFGVFFPRASSGLNTPI